MNAFKIALLALWGCTGGLGQGAACVEDQQCGKGLACYRQLCMRVDQTRVVWSPSGAVIPPGARVIMRAGVQNPHVLDGSIPLNVQGALSLEGTTIQAGKEPVTVVGPELGKRAFFDVVPHAMTLLTGQLGGPGRFDGTSGDARIPEPRSIAVLDGDRVAMLSADGLGVFDGLTQIWQMRPDIDVSDVLSIESDAGDRLLLRGKSDTWSVSLASSVVTSTQDPLQPLRLRFPDAQISRDRLSLSLAYALGPSGVVRWDSRTNLTTEQSCAVTQDPFVVAGGHGWQFANGVIYRLPLSGDCTRQQYARTPGISALAVQDEGLLFYYAAGVLRSHDAAHLEKDLAGVTRTLGDEGLFLSGTGEVAVHEDGRVFLFEGSRKRELGKDGVAQPVGDVAPATGIVFWNGEFWGIGKDSILRPGQRESVAGARALAPSADTLFIAAKDQIWAKGKDSPAQPWVSGDYSFVAVAGPRLFAANASVWSVFDVVTGEQLWSAAPSFTARAVAPADAESVWVAADRSVHRVFLDGLGSVRYVGDDVTAIVALGDAPLPVSRPWQLARAADGALLIYDRNEAALLRFAPKAK